MCDLPTGLFEVVARAIFYPVGWPIVKLLTLGKYPVKGSWFAETPAANWATGMGVATLAIIMMALLHQFDFDQIREQVGSHRSSFTQPIARSAP